MITKIFRKIFTKKLVIPLIYKGYRSADIINLKPWLKKYEIGDFSYGMPTIFDFSEDDDIASLV